MSLEIEPEEAWRLMKKFNAYEKYKKSCFDIDVLQHLADNLEYDEIIDKIVEKIINED